jgi:hypothetical protein
MGHARHLLFCLFALLVPAISGCSCLSGDDPDEETEEDDTSSSGEPLPCGIDCAGLDTPACTVAVCNLGQVIGPLNSCVVVPADQGTSCDDGQFCTSEDACNGDGSCVGGSPNDCGLAKSPCDAVICYEDSQSCSVTPASDGTSCTPDNLCQLDGVCQTGQCIGEEKDCGFSPLNECNSVECDPATGQCVGTPDEFKDNDACNLTGDVCAENKVCQNGECVGGTPKDCSGLDFECSVGSCDPATGLCKATTGPAVVGLPCIDGVTSCQVGECKADGSCEASAAPNGSDCNDHDSCTVADQCVAGACADSNPVAGCSDYFREGFESCPNGWAFGGDWECGAPTNVGPSAAHAGSGVIATKLDSVYSINQSFTTAFAESPAIDLTGAVAPKLSFWAWDHTEGGTFDGWNLKISTNGGTSFTELTTVTPAYPLLIGVQPQQEPAWGGDHAAEGWKPYSADLTSFAGDSIILRFTFRSDGASVYPGVYIDDVVVAEPLHDPLYITTDAQLPEVYTDMVVSIPLARVGGEADAEWSIVPGGTNDGWLSIDPTTGTLSGAANAAQPGAVKVTVRVEQPTLPSNYDEKTFQFTVTPDIYYTSFEGACPNGWTLTGDWECGVPSMVGPATAYTGSQCIATQIDANYSPLKNFATTTATSPDIDLTLSASPVLSFRMWIDTEGGDKDGVRLEASTDGSNYSLVDTVTPFYNLSISNVPAWGAHQSGVGWRAMEVDLSAYAGQVIRFRFAFRSDGANEYPGVYIDEVLVK